MPKHQSLRWQALAAGEQAAAANLAGQTLYRASGGQDAGVDGCRWFSSATPSRIRVRRLELWVLGWPTPLPIVSRHLPPPLLHRTANLDCCNQPQSPNPLDPLGLGIMALKIVSRRGGHQVGAHFFFVYK
ncbi:hypothetical protein NDU88_001259 [Pleurodeles waltl]|uniref:Uncharacterized protein n=1 Tax=Pleurodeles waltl TaxID=8319 RepID=A0AAV7SAC4_PLEWA|nr:hypothetical protein NDU88_001259 [Pleurodeles waltl]